MDSSTSHNYHQQPNSGLLRFNSAPSSVFANFTDRIIDGGVSTINKSNFDSERLISRFMSSGGDNSGNNNTSFQEFEDKSPISYGNPGLPPHYPRQSSPMDSSFELLMDQVKPVTSSLLRQSSSPAGLFAKLSSHNGYATATAAAKEVGNYGGVNVSNGEVISPTTSRLKSQLSFSSRQPSSLGMLSQINEIENENESNDIASSPNDGFPYGGTSWNNSTQHFTETDRKLFSTTQNGELGNCGHMLSHQMSLPKTSAEMAAVEKYLQFQDSVPCKIRAKRGCATHPRSIAERVRRTRISERMRKLQELVPNMDKQTNTADMLDLAVDYIKDLQKQFKNLSDHRANCKCSKIQKTSPNQNI